MANDSKENKSISEINKRNRELGDRYERQTYRKIKDSCTFAARFGGNATSRSTPDVMCLQTGEYPKLRLIEAKRSGYIEPDQRDTLTELAEQSEDWVQIEVRHKISPRKNKKRIIKQAGNDGSRTREILEDEFDHYHFQE